MAERLGRVRIHRARKGCESAITVACGSSTTTPELKALVAELTGAPYLALDTEFMRDQTYWPKLCLIQVAAPGVEAIIDPLADGIDLAPFYELLKSPGRREGAACGAAGHRDLPPPGRRDPRPAVRHPDRGDGLRLRRCGVLRDACRKIAHVEIDKSARFTDWSRRPLSQKQLEYALADVTHLRVIYECLKRKLEKTGRAAWVEEEIAALQDPALYALDPEIAWKRLKPRTTNKRFLAMLASLAAWREREAQARDIPRGRVLKDEALSEIAAHPPESAEALERIRAVPKGFANSRLGKGLMEAIARRKTRQAARADRA